MTGKARHHLARVRLVGAGWRSPTDFMIPSLLSHLSEHPEDSTHSGHTPSSQHTALSKTPGLAWDFPAGPMVKTPPCQCRGCGLISGQGTNSLYTMQQGQKKKQQQHLGLGHLKVSSKDDHLYKIDVELITRIIQEASGK